MVLLKKIKDRKVNIEFNKEFIKVFNDKIKSHDTDFLDKSLKELPDQKISSNSSSNFFNLFILIILLIIIFQEYIEDKIKTIITDLTTQSALKKRVKNEKSTEPEAISDAILTSSINQFFSPFIFSNLSKSLL